MPNNRSTAGGNNQGDQRTRVHESESKSEPKLYKTTNHELNLPIINSLCTNHEHQSCFAIYICQYMIFTKTIQNLPLLLKELPFFIRKVTIN